MTSTYTEVGRSLYDFMSDLDIESVIGETWAQKFNGPPKQIEDYPAFTVVPAEDTEDTLDSDFDEDVVTFWIFVYDTYVDASDSEDRMRSLVDMVRSAIRLERAKPAPLGDGNYRLSNRGSWGANIEEGERFYRLEVEVRVAQDTQTL